MIGSYKGIIGLGGQGGRIGDSKGGLGGREGGFLGRERRGRHEEVLGDSEVWFDGRSEGWETGSREGGVVVRRKGWKDVEYVYRRESNLVASSSPVTKNNVYV
jgi:hypothetical protein